MDLKSQKNIKSEWIEFRFFTLKTTNMFNKLFLLPIMQIYKLLFTKKN